MVATHFMSARSEFYMLWYLTIRTLGSVASAVVLVAVTLASIEAVAATKQTILILRETDGQLLAWSSLPAGGQKVPSVTRRGKPVVVHLSVLPGDEPLRRVQSFRFEAWGSEIPTPEGYVTRGRTIREGFAAFWEPTSSAERYAIRFETNRMVEGQPVLRQATLRRGYGGYYLTFQDGMLPPVVCRAKTIPEMMLEFPTAYRAIEESAHQCSLVGLSLVPQSRFSPLVIRDVMGETVEEDIPAPQIADWQQLVEQLDDDRYDQRVAASDALMAIGVDVVKFLAELDPRQLTLEQRSRIRYIMRTFTVESPPEPEPLPRAEVRKLQQELPPDWLAHLLMATEEPIRTWAVDKLHRQNVLVELSPRATRTERRELYRDLLERLSN